MARKTHSALFLCLTGIDGLLEMASMPLADAQFRTTDGATDTFACIEPGGYCFFDSCSYNGLVHQALIRCPDPVFEVDGSLYPDALNCFNLSTGRFACIAQDEIVYLQHGSGGSPAVSIAQRRVSAGQRFYVRGSESGRMHGPFLKLASAVSMVAPQDGARAKNALCLSDGRLLTIADSAEVIRLSKPRTNGTRRKR